MPALIFFLASSFLHLRQKEWRRLLADELLILGTLFALPSVICKPVLFFLLLLLVIDDFLFKRLGLRLRPEIYSHFLQPAMYWGSVRAFFKDLGFPLCFFLAASFFLAIIPNTPFWPGAALVFFGLIQSPKDHFLILTFKDLFIRKKSHQAPQFKFTFPTEDAHFVSPDYPLLRKTKRFLGEKQFDLAIGLMEKPHLIFCFLESFRQQNIDTHAPYFSSLTRKGIYFPEFYSNSNCTSWATISSLFGIPPSLHPSYLQTYIDMPMMGLPKILQEAGYKTAAIQGAHLMFQETAAFYHAHGFQTILGKNEILQADPDAKSLSWGVHDEALFRFSAKWLARQKESVFLSLFTISNHHPWSRPPGWTPPENTSGTPYLETYAYTDWALGQWMKQLEEMKLDERCIFFFFGDHGQNHGEHDPSLEMKRSLYEEMVKVPLLIYAPGRIAKPQVIHEPCSQIDLLPTVLDMFHLQSLHHSLGTSLLRKKRRFVYFTFPFNGGTLACRLGKWKQILRGPGSELYDLQTDPHERCNLSGHFDRRSKKLKKMLETANEALQALYKKKALCPRHDRIHFAPQKDITDGELERELKQRRELFSLDLSKCQKITGNQIIGLHLRSLSLSGCFNINAEKIASACPNLFSLDLSHCLFLTSSCLTSFLRNCKHLDTLKLNGATDLKSVSTEFLPPLRIINLLNCPSLDGSWAQWLSSLSFLMQLQICCSNWSDAEFLNLKGGAWRFLYFSDCQRISSSSICSVLSRNKNLNALILEDCTITEQELISSLRGAPLKYLCLARCSNIKDLSSLNHEFPGIVLRRIK